MIWKHRMHPRHEDGCCLCLVYELWWLIPHLFIDSACLCFPWIMLRQRTFGLLDNQPDPIFVHEDTCVALWLSGVLANLLLSTMYAENKLASSCEIKVSRLEVWMNQLRYPFLMPLRGKSYRQNGSIFPTREMVKNDHIYILSWMICLLCWIVKWAFSLDTTAPEL